MKEKNIFIAGTPVSGESMIGYKRYLDELWDMVSVGNNVAITGMRKTGKTSLVKEVEKKYREVYKESGVLIHINMGLCKSFDDFCNLVGRKLHEIFSIHPQWYTDTVQFLASGMIPDKYNSVYMEAMTQIFSTVIYENSINCYLVMDEFDNASNIFTTEHYQFLRGLSDSGVHLITLSRRPVYIIEKKTDPINSVFHGIMINLYISGFDSENITDYYDILKNDYGIILSDEQKEQVYFYAGRSPYIYSMFGQRLVMQKNKNDKISIEDAFRKCGSSIDEYNKSIYQILLTDSINREGMNEVCTAEKLISVVFGPTLNLTKEDVGRLKEQGYLYSYEKNGKEYYGALSEDFTNFLAQQEYSTDSWKLILTVERHCKLMVRRAMQRLIGQEEITYSEWSELFRKAGRSHVLSQNNTFIENTRKVYGQDLDLLDVTSLEVVVSIIHVDWEKVYKQFFHGTPWEEWSKKLEMCAWARNPYAHGHGERLLTTDETNQVNRYCEEIIKVLEETGACNDVEAGKLLHDDRVRKDIRKQYYDIVNSEFKPFSQDMAGKGITFVAAIENDKGIKGFFSYKQVYYTAFVGKDKWLHVAHGQTRLDIHVGKRFNAKIETVNTNTNSINIRIVNLI